MHRPIAKKKKDAESSTLRRSFSLAWPYVAVLHALYESIGTCPSGVSCDLRDATCVLYLWSFVFSPTWPIGRGGCPSASVQKDCSEKMGVLVQRFSLSLRTWFNLNANSEIQVKHTKLAWTNSARSCINAIELSRSIEDRQNLLPEMLPFFLEMVALHIRALNAKERARAS